MNYLTTWTPPDSSSPTPASAAKGRDDAPVQHPSWCEAYDNLMIALVAGLTAGPAFLALLGPAGTGKTWMLQAAAAALRQRGQPVILVRRGELPIEVFPGTAVLVDEAARMDDGQLARLAAVRDASVVLADLPAFATRLKQLTRQPTVVPLAPIAREDMPEFVMAWLAARGLPAAVLTHPAVSRLSDHSGGVPRLVVQLLRAALAVNGEMGVAGIGADAVDEMAALRLGGLDTEIALPAVPDTPHMGQQTPGAAPDTPGIAGEEPVAAAPVPPSEAPATPPAPLESVLMASTAGESVQPHRRVRRAPATATLAALAASLLIAAPLAVHHVRQAPVDLGTVLAKSQTTPATPGATHDAEIPRGSDMPAAQQLPVHVPDTAPDAAPSATIAPQAQSEAASSTPPSPASNSSPASDPSLVPGTPSAPSTEAAAAPMQEPAIAASPDQATAPVPEPNPPEPNPPEPAPPGPPAPAVAPPAPNGGRLASIPSITIVAPHAAPSTAEPVPMPLREEPAQSPAQPGGAPGLILVAHAGDTMPDLYAKVYRGLSPPPYAEVVAANHLPLRAGAIVVFPMPQGGWPAR